MNWLWQLNTDTVFKYSDKCTVQKHHPSTVSITIFVDFCGVILYTPFCTVNLKCISCTIHYMEFVTKIMASYFKQKNEKGKKNQKTNITDSNTILGLIPAVSSKNYI